jgi:hypothetical protein
MSRDLLQNATHVTDIKGILNVATSDIPNEGVAGTANGEIYYNSTLKDLRIKSGTAWYGMPFTTTSTSSSTSTSTSTTTS